MYAWLGGLNTYVLDIGNRKVAPGISKYGHKIAKIRIQKRAKLMIKK